MYSKNIDKAFIFDQFYYCEWNHEIFITTDLTYIIITMSNSLMFILKNTNTRICERS